MCDPLFRENIKCGLSLIFTLERNREKAREEGVEKGFLNALWQLLTFRFEISREYFDRHFQALELKTIEQLYKTALRVQNLTEFEEALDTTSAKAKKD